jgi:voltage-gated potassium channel
MFSDYSQFYKRIRPIVLAFLFVLLVGTLGYKLIVPEISFFDGLYMTFVTVTTIGYAEVVQLEGNNLGRIFTIIIAFFGIGVLTYGLSNTAAFIIETDLTKPFRERKMEKSLKKLKGHFIICGWSTVGKHVADELDQTQRPFVVGDWDQEIVDEVNGLYEYGMAFKGDCTDDDFLKKLNVQEAEGLFISTRNDHQNIVICVTARQLNKSMRIVAHCKDMDSRKKLHFVGADSVVSPSSIGGLRMASEMVRPTVTSFLDTMLRDTNQNLRIEEVTILEEYAGKTLADLPLEELEKPWSWLFGKKASGPIILSRTIY